MATAMRTANSRAKVRVLPPGFALGVELDLDLGEANGGSSSSAIGGRQFRSGAHGRRDYGTGRTEFCARRVVIPPPRRGRITPRNAHNSSAVELPLRPRRPNAERSLASGMSPE